MSRARAETSVQASSRLSTPATCAAAISPIEWPGEVVGLDAERLEQAVERDLRARRARAGRCRSGSGRRRRRPTSTSSRRGAGRPRRTRSRNAGNASYSSRPMPRRWEPWPVNSIASCFSPCGTARDLGTVEKDRAVVEQRARRQGVADVLRVRGDVARAGRPAPAPRPTSPTRPRHTATATSTAAGPSRAARNRSRCAGPRGPPSPSSQARSDNSGAGGASRIRCEFVPETPNDEMPMRRGRSTDGHGVAEVSSETEPAVQSTWDEGVVDVQGARQDAVPHRLHDLDHRGDARRRLRVTDVRLDRADVERNGAVLAVGGDQRRRPRSGRPAWCRCRAPPRRRRRPATARRRPAPRGSRVAATGRSARSDRWRHRPG